MENNKDSIVICPGAQVIGDVELGEDVSIWHGAVVRGDTDSITIGNRSNVQDNCVVHCTKASRLKSGKTCQSATVRLYTDANWTTTF